MKIGLRVVVLKQRRYHGTGGTTAAANRMINVP
jgi:hypothetical protein